MQQYLALVREVLGQGTRKPNRTGVDTLSIFNFNYAVDLVQGFPLLTTKAISWKNILVENLWFLSGATDIGLLKKHGCRFWDPWADENGQVPSAYGNFWRHFPGHNERGEPDHNDQIAWLVDELQHNPMSRRLLVTAWAPGNAQCSGLPPCHALWVVNVQLDAKGRQRLCLHLTQRSCDVALGVPYNLAGYSFLLLLLSHFSGIAPGTFAHTLVDAHVYTAKEDGSMAEYDHIPGLQKQLLRQPKALPSLRIDESIKKLDDISAVLDADTDTLLSLFRVEGYNPEPAINFKVAV